MFGVVRNEGIISSPMHVRRREERGHLQLPGCMFGVVRNEGIISFRDACSAS